MIRGNILINSLNTGEVSELIESRSDLSKYAAACKTLENAVPLVEGGAKKMPGTYFAGTTANGGSMFTGSIVASTLTLTVTEIKYGVVQVGQTLVGAGVLSGTTITADGTGAGGIGTYTISEASLDVASEPMQTASNGKSRLDTFQFSTGQGAFLEFSAGFVRIWEGASQGNWSLGLAQQVPPELDYNPATAYVPGNAVLVGPTGVCYKFNPGVPLPGLGVLYIAAPYGTTNANTVQIVIQINSTDALVINSAGVAGNQSLYVYLANTTPSHNAAAVIQAAIRSIGSLNVGTSNFVDLTAWTVTPDAVYYATPWTSYSPAAGALTEWAVQNSVAECLASNQNDEFPLKVTVLGHRIFLNSFNSAYWGALNLSTEPPIELVTPYLEGDLFELDCSTQSADVLWVFHSDYPPAVIERLSANSWQYSLDLPGQQPGEAPYRGTTDVVKTGYSALGQNISLISQSNPCTVVLASSSTSQPFTNGSRIYINQCAGLVELNEGEFLVSGMTYGTTTITVIDGAGVSSTITISSPAWYMTLIDPTTAATVNSSSYLQYAGGGFAVAVVPLFGSIGNYPACGTLYQERLCVGGADNTPTQINGSVQGDYPDFITDPNAADFAFQFTFVSNQVNQLLNMIGTPNALMIGTSGGVWVVAGSTGSSLSQSNVSASLQSTIGVSALQPQLVNGSAVFVSRSARIVTFMTFSFATNAWDNIDLTRLNRNITIGTSAATSGIAQTAFQVEPYPIFWAVRNDGQLIGLVFNTQDQVYAWFRVNMPGGIIESVAVISGQGQEDQVAVVVNRTINGLTRRYVEYFMPQELFHQLSNAFFVHSGLQFQGVGPFNITGISNANPCVVTAPGHTLVNGQSIAIAGVLGMTQANTNPLMAWTVAGVSGDTLQLLGIDSTGWSVYTSGGTVEQVTNQVTGMSYLLGQTVVAIGDQQVIFQGPVPSDTVVFGAYANQVTIGLPFTTTIQPMNPVIGSPQATSKGKKQKFSRATLSLYESIGGLVGIDGQHLYDIDYGANSLGNPPSLTTGNITVDLDGDWGDEDTILVVHSDPYPFCLRSVTPRLSVADEG